MRPAVLALLLAGCLRAPPFAGVSGDAKPSDGSEDANGSGTSDASADAFVYDANLVFVTSTTTSVATMGGISGANTMCGMLAQAAGHPGTYVAWLSTSGTPAPMRLGSARGWVRPDGKPFTDQVSDLLAGKIFYPLRLDENGNDLGSVKVMTGTRANGTTDPFDCNDLSSTSSSSMIQGESDATYARWTDANEADVCTAQKHLYCFQTDKTNPVMPAPVSGRRAFVSTTWTPSGGLTNGADQHCAADATSAGLSGTFKALLAISGDTAASRFSSGGTTWVRLDGIPLAGTAAALLAGAVDTTLNVAADGTYVGDEFVWTGATTPSANGMTSTCTDWTVSSSGSGVAGIVVHTSAFWFSFGPLQCTNSYRLYCLEP